MHYIEQVIPSHFRLHCFVLKILISQISSVHVPLGMSQTGASQAAVARTLNVSQSVISRRWARYRHARHVADRGRSGQPRATTAPRDR